MFNEQDKIRKIMKDMAEGKDIGNKLIYDRNTKTVKPAKECQDPDSTIKISPSDAELFK